MKDNIKILLNEHHRKNGRGISVCSFQKKYEILSRWES